MTGSAPSTPPRILAPHTTLAARYQIEALVGRGGMGAVYRARDVRLATAVWAVKEMWADDLTDDERAEARQSFEREALLLAGLSHAALPRVVDYFSENGRNYLVMEFIEGETLEARIERDGLPDVDCVLRWMEQVGDVLMYLHERPQPIVFRDVKPANVMLTKAGGLKLIDFGIARYYSSTKNADTVAFGTPGYAAPEQYGRAQSDARVDVFGFGATLHFLLTGRDPSLTPFAFEPPSRLRTGLSPAFDAVVLQAVALNANDRFTSVRAMMAALQAAGRTPSRPTAAAPPLQRGQGPHGTCPLDASAAPAPPIGPAPSVASAPTGTAHTPTVTPPLQAAATTVPAPAAAATVPAPAPAAPRFERPSFSFGRMRRGETQRVNLRILGEVEGVLASSERKWLRVQPRHVRGQDPVVQLILSSGRLSEGKTHHAVVTLNVKRGASQSQLAVDVDVTPARTGILNNILAGLFTIGALFPLAGLLSTALMGVLYFTCPADERPALRSYVRLTGIFTLLNLIEVVGFWRFHSSLPIFGW